MTDGVTLDLVLGGTRHTLTKIREWFIITGRWATKRDGGGGESERGGGGGELYF